MRKFMVLCQILSLSFYTIAQQCRFEKSNGKESATYFEAISWYKALGKNSKQVLVKEMGMTDAGYPLHLVLVSADGKFDPQLWHVQKKAVLLINNGIHPGEPDGIDACMLLVRDIVTKKISMPENVVLAIIPVYNIGGCLNRNNHSRANQNGPLEYGFRGNSQNLDLNRDFTKCDTREARSFTQLFHWLEPTILIDNHVSDGADYQHTMTLITTQYDKLGGGLGNWVKNKFEPQLYEGMAQKKWDMVPYVDFSTSGPENGMEMFYDPPRYSSGYAALFHTISFIPETHMLKPFKDRVLSTYALMMTFIEKSSSFANEILLQQKRAQKEELRDSILPLHWSLDSSQYSFITFKGYAQSFKTSDATGLKRMFYDHNKPFTKQVKYFNVFKPHDFIIVPKAYLIPQGWYNIIALLKLNNVLMNRLKNDTILEVDAYHIDDYKSLTRPYEKHHKNSAVKVTVLKQKINFLKGDYVVSTDQLTKNYIVQMLEPTGDDSFFAWNFFDAILQQKEGYSDYRWDDLAAEVLKNDPVLKIKLEDKKSADPKFSENGPAQLEFIYRNSPYYEPAHNRYPIYRLPKEK